MSTASQPSSPRSARARQLARDESGVVAIEFALVLPFILLFFFVIIDFGQIFNNVNDLNQLAANGARFAAVNTKPVAGSSLQAGLVSQADTNALRNEAKVCVSFPGVNSNVGQPVMITATSNFDYVPLLQRAFKELGLPTTVALHGKATMRIEVAPTAYSEGCS